MKRIGIAVKTTEGGRWILPQIREARNRGLDVIVLLPKGDGRLARMVTELAASDPGVTLERAQVEFTVPGWRAIREILALRKRILDLKLDAVLYHLYATALMFRFATLGTRLRRVHMVAGPLYLESKKIRIVERILARLDTIVICGSRYTYNLYRSIGIPERRLRIVPYGVDIDEFCPPTPEEKLSARAALDYKANEFVAVMVAYVYAPKNLVFAGRGIKGHEDVLAAWRMFSAQHPDARLLLVGGGFGPEGERYRQTLIDAVPGGLHAHHIRWLDSVDDVRIAYAAADISVSPSLSDNHGAALEASAMGVPCVVSGAGALPEAIDRNAGWVHRAGSVSSLLAALESAYEAGSNRQLEDLGRQARKYMTAKYSQAQGAIRVIDIVTDTERQEPGDARDPKQIRPETVTMFSEARIARNSLGHYVTHDSMMAEDKWERALVGLPGMRLAARVEDRGDASGSRIHGDIVPLPYYVGFARMILALPRLIRTIGRSVETSRVVCAKLPGVIGMIAIFCANRRGVVVVAEVVGDISEVLSTGAAGRLARHFAPVARLMTQIAVRRASVVRYVTRQVLQQRYPARADAHAISYTDVVIDNEIVQRSPNQIERGLIVAVGSQEQLYKGHDDLIRALPILARAHDEVHLELIGDGRYQAHLKSMAAELGVGERVAFTGYVSDRMELNSRLDRAHVFALPSKTEGLPRALIEAMSRGLPCVASRVGGVPELLDNSVTFPAGDVESLVATTSRLLGDAGYCKKQADRNAAVASRYSRSNMEQARKTWREAVVALLDIDRV
ncbi:glycosyltransferase [Humibacter sp.]|uniref:glycosyltransferase n=1 Tax=Humibacter sp. TaxID=1940291 RepID=UPI003F801B99